MYQFWLLRNVLRTVGNLPCVLLSGVGAYGSEVSEDRVAFGKDRGEEYVCGVGMAGEYGRQHLRKRSIARSGSRLQPAFILLDFGMADFSCAG